VLCNTDTWVSNKVYGDCSKKPSSFIITESNTLLIKLPSLLQQLLIGHINTWLRHHDGHLLLAHWVVRSSSGYDPCSQG